MRCKTLFMSIALIIITGLIVGCSSNEKSSKDDANENSEAAVIKLAHVTSEDTAYAVGVEKFAELVKEKTDGEVVVEVYPNASLGNNTELIEQLQKGTIGAMIPSAATLSGFTDKTLLLDLPFLFKNQEAAEAVMDGEIGDEILASLEDADIIGLGWFNQGWRHFFTNDVPVEKPEDLKGQKIRILETPVHVDFMKAYGATGIPIAFAEVFTSLEQGVVDGAENPYTNIVINGYNEVSKYITETAHIYDALPIIMSKVVWDTLSEEHQGEIQEAAYAARDFERDLIDEAEVEIKQEIIDGGKNEIIELTDEERQAFADAAKPVYEKWDETIGDDLIQRVLEAQDDY